MVNTSYRPHSRPQRPRSFRSTPRIATSGHVPHRKCVIHGLPVTLRMLRVKSDKSEWFWSQSTVLTNPFKTGMSLNRARGRDSWCWPKGARPLGTRIRPEPIRFVKLYSEHARRPGSAPTGGGKKGDWTRRPVVWPLRSLVDPCDHLLLKDSWRKDSQSLRLQKKMAAVGSNKETYLLSTYWAPNSFLI